MAGSNPDLVVRVAANIAALQTDMAAAVATIKSLDDTVKTASASTGGWSSVLDTLGGSFVARVADGVLLRDAIRELLGAMKETIEALPDLIEHTISVGNSLFEMAVKTGSSVEGLSALRYVASQTGIDFNSFGTTISMLEKNLGATGKAGEKVGEVLASMGLDLATVKSMRSDEAFTTIAQSLFEVGNNADKAHDAALLMGKGAKEMAVLWHEDIGPMIEEAKDLGLVMSTETAAGAHLAEIGFQALHMQVEALGIHIATAFLPAIIGLEGDLQVGLTEAVKTLTGQLGALGGNGGALALVARAMGTGDDAIKAQLDLYEYLKTALIGVVRNGLEPMVTAVAYGMVGFNAAKVIIGDVVQVINYLAIGYEKAALALEQFNAFVTTGSAKEMWTRQIAETQAVIDGLYREVAARGASIAGNKKSEQDWMDWSVSAHRAIEVSLTAIGAAHTDVGHKMKEMGDVSRAAYGMASDGVDTLSGNMKAFEKAVEDVNSAGIGWKGTLDTIDGAVVESMRDLIAAGVSIKTLETYYGLTATQGKAFTDMLKDEATQLTLNERTWAELQKVTAAHYKTLNSLSHDTVGALIDDAYVTAAAQIAEMYKVKSYSIAAEMEIWANAEDVANKIIAKTLESDVHSKAHFVKLADDARIAYEFATAHADQYTSGWIIQLQKTADAAKLAADTFGMSFDAALGAVDAHVATTINGFHQLAMATAAASIAGGTESSNQALIDQGYSGITGFATAGELARGFLPDAVTIAQRAAHGMRAEGGPVSAGETYLVGEKGPEVLKMGGNGFITPNGGGGGVNVVIQFSAIAPGDARAQEALRQVVEKAVITALGTRVHLS